MSNETKEAATEKEPTPRKFVFSGMELTDIDPSMSAEQIREVYSGTYPELANAKIKGPEKDANGVETFTFVRNVGSLG